MREIKFRAWDEDGFMFEPDKIEFNKTHKGDTWVWRGNIFGQDGSAVNLMQYTGLHDKNGKEIYEGDILLAQDFGQPKRAIAFVKYQGSGFVPHKHKSTVWYEWCPIKNEEGSSWEVIGNIYDNPELLKS